jgi:hypothetical protein
MRYVTLVMRPADDRSAFHPIGERLAEDPAVRREAIHRMDPMGDGTLVLLAEASGDLDRYREILADEPTVQEWTVSVGERGYGYAYSRVETNDLTERLVDRGAEAPFVREMPVDITEDGGQRVTLVGTEEAFASVEPSGPEGVTFEIERMGEYEPGGGRLIDALTARQREILAAAIDAGYYDQPRQASHAEIADAVACSPATVSEHLQKIERSVFTALRGSL